MRWEKSTNSCVHIHNFSIIVFSLNNFYGYKSSTKLVGFQILAGYETMVITCLIHAPDKRKSDKRLRKINKKAHNIPMTNISTTIHDTSWQGQYKLHDTFFSPTWTWIHRWSSGLKVNVWLPITKPKSWKTGRPSTEPTGSTNERWNCLYQTRVTHTKLENKKQHGTIQNQFRCI